MLKSLRLPLPFLWVLSYAISAIVGFFFYFLSVYIVGDFYLRTQAIQYEEAFGILFKLFFTLIPIGIFYMLTTLNYSQSRLLGRYFLCRMGY